MSKMQRRNQGGSIATYIIIGVVLTLVLVSMAYVLKERGEQVRKDQAIAASDSQQEKDRKPQPEKEAEKPPVAETDTDKAPRTSSELPATGPEALLGELLGAGFLTLAIASYLSSRRDLAARTL